jgi:hypothetical protein
MPTTYNPQREGKTGDNVSYFSHFGLGGAGVLQGSHPKMKTEGTQNGGGILG